MDLLIPGPVGDLEATLWMPKDPVEPRAACALCHPHPLHGGTMNNTVVFRTARGLQQAGLAVLRFNFRGVGRSQGTHDGQGGEEKDLEAALDHLEREMPGVELWAGGFSFGSRNAASHARRDARIARVILIALPVGAFDMSFLRELEKPGLVLMAGKDEYGTLDALRMRFPDLYPGLETEEVPDVNHYFQGATGEVQSRVRAYAERVLARPT
jgi:alpha/beta superfamily hydrolase